MSFSVLLVEYLPVKIAANIVVSLCIVVVSKKDLTARHWMVATLNCFVTKSAMVILR